MLLQSSGVPCEGRCVALYGCKGSKALYLCKAVLQGGYPQVGWRPILKTCCSRALPADSKQGLSPSRGVSEERVVDAVSHGMQVPPYKDKSCMVLGRKTYLKT